MAPSTSVKYSHILTLVEDDFITAYLLYCHEEDLESLWKQPDGHYFLAPPWALPEDLRWTRLLEALALEASDEAAASVLIAH